VLLASHAGDFPKPAPFGGGLDKLELRLPNQIPMQRGLSDLIAASKVGERKPRVGPGGLYEGVIDLRPEHPALLHFQNRYSPGKEHKLEFLEVGRQSFDGVLDELSQMFDADPLRKEEEEEEAFGTMRVDVAVDLPDVPVSFFRERTRVQFKRFGAQFGTCGEEWQMLGMHGIETIMSGKRSNCYRVYDKRAKWQDDHQKFLRKWRASWGGYRTDKAARDAWLLSGMSFDEWFELRRKVEQIKGVMPEPPSFVELYGIPETAILTRVERQMSAQETKDVHFGQIRTLRLLREHALDFNPFARMIFADAGKPEPNPADYSPRDYMAGMHFRGLIRRDGYAAAVRWLSQYANGNLKRLLASLADFIPCSDGVGVSAPELVERYRDALARQFAA